MIRATLGLCPATRKGLVATALLLLALLLLALAALVLLAALAVRLTGVATLATHLLDSTQCLGHLVLLGAAILSAACILIPCRNDDVPPVGLEELREGLQVDGVGNVGLGGGRIHQQRCTRRKGKQCIHEGIHVGSGNGEVGNGAEEIRDEGAGVSDLQVAGNAVGATVGDIKEGVHSVVVRWRGCGAGASYLLVAFGTRHVATSDPGCEGFSIEHMTTGSCGSSGGVDGLECYRTRSSRGNGIGDQEGGNMGR